MERHFTKGRRNITRQYGLINNHAKVELRCTIIDIIHILSNIEMGPSQAGRK